MQIIGLCHLALAILFKYAIAIKSKVEKEKKKRKKEIISAKVERWLQLRIVCNCLYNGCIERIVSCRFLF